MQSISLKDLLLAVRQNLYQTFDRGYWIRAEISEIRENANGHCYLELIEKDSSGKLIVAKTKASIWADTYRMLKPYFKEETGESLNVGLKVLVEVTVNFHEIYGFSCVIRDIDPHIHAWRLGTKASGDDSQAERRWRMGYEQVARTSRACKPYCGYFVAHCRRIWRLSGSVTIKQGRIQILL